MPKTTMTVARVAELCARLINRESQGSIQKGMGVNWRAMKNAIESLRAHGLAVELQAPSRIRPEQEARLHDLFRSTVKSNRAIVAETGVPLTSVNKSRRRFNAALVKSGGELPMCACGKYLHHARMCGSRLRQGLKDRGVRSVTTLEPFQQEDVRRRLLAGASMRSEAERTGLPKGAIGSFLRTFRPEERRQRNDSAVVASARRRSAKLNNSILRPRAFNPAVDPLYAQIAQAVPRGIDPALRDDMISQAYLEYLEGRLDPKRLRDDVKKVRGRVFRDFANPWGNRSLDVSMNDDGDGQTWANNIPDERALHAFDAVN